MVQTDHPSDGHSRIKVGLVASLPVLLALAVYVFALPEVHVGGDEPHYMIMADGLLTDRSFDLRTAYEREAQAPVIMGRINPHVKRRGQRWMPYHTPGLSMLIALPQRLARERGVRVALALMMGLLPLTLFTWLRHRLNFREAAWLTLGATICTPTLFGSTRVFPDLPAGVLATASAVWIMDRPGRDTRALTWLVAGAAAGFVAWLHVKFCGAAAILFLGFLAVAAQEASGGRRRAALMATLGAACVIAVVLALLQFNVWAYGRMLGARAWELSTSLPRGAELFLGLHFDQSQGLFVRNPLLLGGVLFLPVFIRRHPLAACLWGLLYLSLILPNSLQLARYGGGSPTSRFAWSAMWLWTVPLGVGVSAIPRMQRLVPAAAAIALVYQAALAARWLRAPLALSSPALAEQLDKRDSLFPVALRDFLPSFYFWDFSSYWTHPPNVAAYGVTLALLLAGIALAMPPSPVVDQLGVVSRTGEASG